MPAADFDHRADHRLPADADRAVGHFQPSQHPAHHHRCLAVRHRHPYRDGGDRLCRARHRADHRQGAAARGSGAARGRSGAVGAGGDRHRDRPCRHRGHARLCDPALSSRRVRSPSTPSRNRNGSEPSASAEHLHRRARRRLPDSDPEPVRAGMGARRFPARAGRDDGDFGRRDVPLSERRARDRSSDRRCRAAGRDQSAARARGKRVHARRQSDRIARRDLFRAREIFRAAALPASW